MLYSPQTKYIYIYICKLGWYIAVPLCSVFGLEEVVCLRVSASPVHSHNALCMWRLVTYHMHCRGENKWTYFTQLKISPIPSCLCDNKRCFQLFTLKVHTFSKHSFFLLSVFYATYFDSLQQSMLFNSIRISKKRRERGKSYISVSLKKSRG